MSYWHQLVGRRSAQVLVHLSNSLWGFTSLKPWEWTWKFLMRCRPGLTLTGRFESLKGQLIDCSSHSHTLSTFWKIVFKEFNKMMRINHEKAAEVSCCSTGGCSTVQHSTVQYSSIQNCTVQPGPCVSHHTSYQSWCCLLSVSNQFEMELDGRVCWVVLGGCFLIKVILTKTAQWLYKIILSCCVTGCDTGRSSC